MVNTENTLKTSTQPFIVSILKLSVITSNSTLEDHSGV